MYILCTFSCEYSSSFESSLCINFINNINLDGKQCIYFFDFKGPNPVLLIANDAELRILNANKPSEEWSNNIGDKQSGVHKLESLDVLWDPRETTVFWSDHQHHTIQSKRLDLPTKGENSGRRRNRRDIFQTVVS